MKKDEQKKELISMRLKSETLKSLNDILAKEEYKYANRTNVIESLIGKEREYYRALESIEQKIIETGECIVWSPKNISIIGRPSAEGFTFIDTKKGYNIAIEEELRIKKFDPEKDVYNNVKYSEEAKYLVMRQIVIKSVNISNLNYDIVERLDFIFTINKLTDIFDNNLKYTIINEKK